MNSPAQRLRGARIALVGDDAELHSVISAELQHEGAHCAGFGSAEALYRHLLEGLSCDVVLLDVMLPGDGDGYSVVDFLHRISPNIGIVMMGVGAEPGDIARGLSLGADLYLAKPLKIPVLVAMLGSLLRRLRVPPQTHASVPARQIQAMDWRLSSDGWTLVSPSLRSLALTEAERAVLRPLFADRGQIVDRDAIIAAITDRPWNFDSHRLEVLIHRLRARVVAAMGEKLPLRAVRGRGYLLDHDPV